MNFKKIQKWLDERNLVLEESFSVRIKNLAKNYKLEKSLKSLDEVYLLIGTSKQQLSYWGNNPCNTGTKNFAI
jgi:hypothetical protein